MRATEDEFIQVANAIQSGNFAEPTVNLLDRIIDDGGASRLVEAIKSIEQGSGKTAEDAVSNTMSRLEALAAISQPAACVLMVALFSAADDLLMHDVTNSIDLWIFDCDSAKVDRQLKLLAGYEENENKRRHYEQLIKNRDS